MRLTYYVQAVPMTGSPEWPQCCAAVTVSGAGQVKFCRAGQCMGTVQFLAWRGQPSLQHCSPAPLLPFILNLPDCFIGNQWLRHLPAPARTSSNIKTLCSSFVSPRTWHETVDAEGCAQPVPRRVHCSSQCSGGNKNVNATTRRCAVPQCRARRKEDPHK